MGLMPFQGDAPPDEGAAPAPRDESRYVEDGEPNVSPEEQGQYDEAVQNALRLLYDQGDVRPQILESLKVDELPQTEEGNGPSPPVLALANAAVQITTHLDDSAREAEKPLDNDVLLHVGIMVISELAEISEAANLHDYTEEEKSGALTVAMDMYRPKAIKDGRTSEEQLKGEFDEAVQADREGRLDQVVPGAGQAAMPQEE